MNKADIHELLQTLHMSADEATVWAALLYKPATHSEVAQATGIGRTTVYRLVDSLSAKGLAHELITERGKCSLK
jgi:sugar-specific transcriptional regulator TrmB